MLVSDFTLSTYNSYFDTIAEVDTAISLLDGVWNVSSWNNLTDTIEISSLGVVSLVATVVTAIDHGYSNGDTITISGALPAGLNGLQTITVISVNSFSYGTTEGDVVATGVMSSSKSDDIKKENLILAATKDANSFNFKGLLNQQVISINNMKWPRTGAFYPNGIAIGNTEVPVCIFDYVSQRILERQANIETGASEANNIKRQKLGSLEQEFFNPKDLTVEAVGLESFDSFLCLEDYLSGASGNIQFASR